MTESALQELPNRIDSSAAKAQRGSSTAVDTNDPLFLDHSGSHYISLPGTADNHLNLAGTTAPTTSVVLEIEYISTPTEASSGGVINAHSCIRIIHNSSPTSYQFGFWTGASYSNYSAPAFDANHLGVRVTHVVATGVVTVEQLVDGVWSEVGSGTVTTGTYATPSYWELGARDGGTSDAACWAGTIKRAKVTDGTGILYDVNPAVDIDTSSDSDAGQSTFTATTGGTVTIGRGTSGLATAVVTRPVMLFDGTDDYLQLPTSDTPTFSKDSGRFSIVAVFRRANANTSGTDELVSFNSAGNNGCDLRITNIDQIKFSVGNGSQSPTAGLNYTNGELVVVAGVVDSGTIYAFNNENGMTVGADITALTSDPVFTSGRVGSSAYSVFNTQPGEVFSVLVFDGVALTEDQLNVLSTKLINGDYV